MENFEIQPEPLHQNTLETIQQAWNHIDNNEYDAALELIEPFGQHPHHEAIYNYHKIKSAAAFRLNDFETAETQAIKVTEITDVKANDWFDLSTSATMNQNIELGEEAFAKAVKAIQEDPDSVSFSIPQMLFYYVQVLCAVDETDKAFEQLDRLKDIYTAIKTTNSDYLQDVGVPFLSNTLDAAMPIFTQIGKDESQAWLDDFASRVDNDGMQLINQFKTNLFLIDDF